MKRREFIKYSLFTAGATPLPLAGMEQVWAATGGGKKKLVMVFLRGAMDVLTALPPKGSDGKLDPKLKALRTELMQLQSIADLKKIIADANTAVRKAELAKSLTNLGRACDSQYDDKTVDQQLAAISQGLNRLGNATASFKHLVHPSLLPLADAFDHNDIRIITHTGSLNPTRSHFEQMDFIESGSRSAILGTGYLGRTAQILEELHRDRSLLSIGSRVPRSLSGADSALVDSADDVAEKIKIKGRLSGQQARIVASSQLTKSERLDLFKYKSDCDEENKLCNEVGAAQVAYGKLATTENTMRDVDAQKTLSQVAKRFQYAGVLMSSKYKADLVTIDVDGWDTHFNQGPNDYAAGLAAKLSILAGGLKDLRQSLIQQGQWQDSVIVVMSEFGRTVASNTALGTDHGRGSMMMILAPNATFNPTYQNGGVLPEHKTWDLNQFDQSGGSAASAALKVKMDFRYVLSDIIKHHLKAPLKNASGSISVFDETLPRGGGHPEDGFLIKKS